MNRRSFMRSAFGCAVAVVAAPVAIRSAVVMVPRRYGKTESLSRYLCGPWDYPENSMFSKETLDMLIQCKRDFNAI